MNISKKSFIKIFETSFWNKMNESLVPFNDKPVDKRIFLEELFQEVTSYSYNPSSPRDYLVSNKHNGISRYVPTFNRKDYCVYYLCVKLIENEIAINRVEGTYGGWTLGNKIQDIEKEELIELEYVPYNSINEFSWSNEWRTFQSIAKKYSQTDEFTFYKNIDIANFYDSKNLTLLERKIRHCVPNKKQDVVTLLFHFLRNWNKKIEGYNLKTVGIPQDEIGDCSRILANFYLQEYDLVMKTICEDQGARYIRFADDQIFYSKSSESSKIILFESSKELFKLNLNINSSKVKEFKSRDEFDTYWAFEIFELLDDKENKENVQKAVELYFTNIDKGVNFRNISVLKRLLTINFDLINPELRHKLISGFYNPEFLSQLTLWHYRRIRSKVDNDKDFFNILDGQIDTVLFNSYHYQLLNFYNKDRKDYDLLKLKKRIFELKT